MKSDHSNNYKKKAALFLASQGVTLFGSSLAQFAMIWYVTMQTSSDVWVSAMTVAAYLPQFLISFFSGVWADRYSRKKLISAKTDIKLVPYKRGMSYLNRA